MLRRRKLKKKIASKKNIYNVPWFVYILKCRDKTLYVGMTLDVLRRLKEHNTTKRCRYTRSRKPSKLVYQEECLNHYAAMCRELEIKSFDRSKKLMLIKNFSRPPSVGLV
jgi:putative endonuclease